jgi:hypothetical protein
MSANAEIIAELRRVLNERDEAREQLDLTKRELGRWVDRETKAVRERDEARALVDQLGTTRDKAEAELRELQRSTSEALTQAVEWQRERDDARAQRDAAIARITEVGVMVATNGNELAKDAYRRGAEAMREASALLVSNEKRLWLRSELIADLRALPIPEEP